MLLRQYLELALQRLVQLPARLGLLQQHVGQMGLGQRRAGCTLQHTHRQLEHGLSVHFQHRIAQNGAT